VACFEARHPEDLRIGLLGGFWVQVGSRRIAQFVSGRKPAQLLKLLAIAPGHRCAREEVEDTLWPESAIGRATNNLHRTLYTARHFLEPDLPRGTHSFYLRLEGNAVMLRGPRLLWIDVEAFEVAAAVALRMRGQAAYEAALRLYEGELLPDDRGEEWAASRREHVRSLYLDMLLGAVRLHEAHGEPEAAIARLQQIVLAEPIHEEAHRRLMRLLAVTGAPQRALRQYARLREVLRRELDVEPDAETEQLHSNIVAGHLGPSLPQAEVERGPSLNATQLGTLILGPAARGPSVLTRREREIVELVGHHLTNRQIAAQLGLSKRTVDTHLGHILRKLGARRRDEVLHWAAQHGLLPPYPRQRGPRV
jgi:DNA-binding SARP family transcriptional activator/DNA-binding CsgD family transcriptional regulator